MMFNSIEFVAFFALVFCTFFFLPERWKVPFLLLASYFFYGVWSVKYLGLLFFTMWLDYWLALRIQSAVSDQRRRAYLAASVVANLGILFVFKYLNLFYGLVAAVTGHAPWHSSLVLPFGISFYTFHAMSYTIDVYRRVIPAERSFTLYSSYVMFFPQLVAGPIARASHLLHQFATPKRFSWENLSQGAFWIAKGYIFKAVLADSFAACADAYFGHQAALSPPLVAQAVYMFAFQIYFDFAGYTLIARGVAKCLDFDLVENFREPYFATSITDFWRRWHISLSTWLRDYLYISLGGNRGGRWKTYRNLMLTMMLGGLWHGGSLTFAAWGTLHGLYLVAEKALSTTRVGTLARERTPGVVKRLWVFHLVLFAWIFFRAESFDQALHFAGDLGKFLAWPFPALRSGEIFWKLWLMAAIAFGYEAIEPRLRLAERFLGLRWYLRMGFLYAAIVLVALCCELNPKAFIYFQF